MRKRDKNSIDEMLKEYLDYLHTEEFRIEEERNKKYFEEKKKEKYFSPTTYNRKYKRL